jgi:Domain of unknown function (DUF4403)
MQLPKSAKFSVIYSVLTILLAGPTLAGPGDATHSAVSAVVEFPLPALESQLDDLIPRRLANFDDHGTECWHRFIFRREFHVDCAYEGYIERTSGIHLSSESGKITAEMTVYGTVSAHGIGRFVRRLHGSTEARLTVYASARPHLLPDWNVALDTHEGFRWREPPVVRILGFPIDLARYAEPAINRQLARVKERVEADVRSLDVRGKAEHVWQKMFSPIELSNDPSLWLQVTPESVAFSGLRATGHDLEGSLEISGTAEATVGSEPAPVQPTPLPALGSEVAAPGEFDVNIPIDLTFSAIEATLQNALATDPQLAGGGLKGIGISSSNGKLAITLRPADGQGATDPVTLLADLKPGANDESIELDDITPSEKLKVPLNLDALTALHDNLSVSVKERIDQITASANERLNQKLADGFRREGHIEIGKAASISVLSDRIRVIANAQGYLRFVYDR